MDADAPKPRHQILLGCDLVLADQREDRFLPLTL
jgi:hypothetical protein